MGMVPISKAKTRSSITLLALLTPLALLALLTSLGMCWSGTADSNKCTYHAQREDSGASEPHQQSRLLIE